jgi:pimeloyl-ACP methyl ester carboxylesterase
MGGGVAVDFAVAHPHLVSDLVLIAPGGLLRTKHVSWKSWLLYTSRLLPEHIVERVIWRRLRGDPGAVPGRSFPMPSAGSTSATADPAQAAAAAEAGIQKANQESTESSSTSVGLKGNVEGAETEGPLVVPGNPNSTVAAIIAWQVEYHEGFIPAFISSIRHAPIHGQHEVWETLGRRLVQARSGTSLTKSFDAGKILMILGKQDPVVIADEVAADSIETLGKDQVTVVGLDCGHEIPITKTDEVVDAIMNHWDV